MLYLLFHSSAAEVWLSCQQAASLLTGGWAVSSLAIAVRGSAVHTLPETFASTTMGIFPVSLTSIPGAASLEGALVPPVCGFLLHIFYLEHSTHFTVQWAQAHTLQRSLNLTLEWGTVLAN